MRRRCWALSAPRAWGRGPEHPIFRGEASSQRRDDFGLPSMPRQDPALPVRARDIRGTGWSMDAIVLAQREWGQLVCAHGTARDVPKSIQKLLSSKGPEQDSAYWELDNNVVLQSDLFDSAAYVAARIVDELVRGSASGGRTRIYRLLVQLRAGSAPAQVQVQLSDGTMLHVRAACSRIIGAALPVFVRDATSADPAVRSEALQLLAALDDRKEEVVGALTAAVNETADESVRRDLLSLISEIQTGD